MRAQDLFCVRKSIAHACQILKDDPHHHREHIIDDIFVWLLKPILSNEQPIHTVSEDSRPFLTKILRDLSSNLWQSVVLKKANLVRSARKVMAFICNYLEKGHTLTRSYSETPTREYQGEHCKKLTWSVLTHQDYAPAHSSSHTYLFSLSCHIGLFPLMGALQCSFFLEVHDDPV